MDPNAENNHEFSCYTVSREGLTVARTNITLSLDSDLVREAKVLAARCGTSVSRLMGQSLEDLVRSDMAYDTARRRAMRRLERAYDLEWERPASRQELHER